jgi:hypothetical protein
VQENTSILIQATGNLINLITPYRYEGEFKGDLKEGKGIYHFGNKN